MLALAAWAGLMVAAAWLVAGGRLGGTLSGFLPRGATTDQRLVTHELRDGISARLLLIALHGPSHQAAAAAASRLRGSLADSDQFRLVADRPDPALLPARSTVFRYRYLLSDRVTPGAFDVAALRSSFRDLVRRLRSPDARVDERIAAADPTGETRHVIAGLFGGMGARASNAAWRTADGWPVLVALPRAHAYDLDAASRMISRIHAAAAALGPGFEAVVSGAPAIAVATRAQVRHEALRVTALASLAILLIVGWALRSVAGVIACAVPVASGLLVGTGTVIAVFGSVHGITLAFAATLLGVTVDYPLHLLWNGAHHRRAALLRPLLMGAASTAIAFAAMGVSGFPGLQQLALLAATGVVTAVSVTLWVLPHLPLHVHAPARSHDSAGRPVTIRPPVLTLALVLIAAGAAWAIGGLHLNTDLSTLSPVPQALRTRDGALRAATGVDSPRYVVRVSAPGRQAALRRTERAVQRLQPPLRNKAVDRVTAVTALVPSAATQRDRRSALPPRSELRARLRRAIKGLPLRRDAFAPFLSAVAASRDLAPLRPDDLPPGFLHTWVDDHLFRFDGRWTSLVGLGGMHDPATVATALRGLPDSGLVDIAATTDTLVTHYQHAALVRAGAGFLGIALLLLVGLGAPRRAAAVLATVGGAVAGALAVPALLGHALNVFEVVSLLLVAGLGLDYALFTTESNDGRGSVTVCAVSTVVAFAVLATADIPVLRDIGATVAVGTTLAWLLALGIAQPTKNNWGE